MHRKHGHFHVSQIGTYHTLVHHHLACNVCNLTVRRDVGMGVGVVAYVATRVPDYEK